VIVLSIFVLSCLALPCPVVWSGLVWFGLALFCLVWSCFVFSCLALPLWLPQSFKARLLFINAKRCQEHWSRAVSGLAWGLVELERPPFWRYHSFYLGLVSFLSLGLLFSSLVLRWLSCVVLSCVVLSCDFLVLSCLGFVLSCLMLSCLLIVLSSLVL
jgi:hypothetical protein